MESRPKAKRSQLGRLYRDMVQASADVARLATHLLRRSASYQAALRRAKEAQKKYEAERDRLAEIVNKQQQKKK